MALPEAGQVLLVSAAWGDKAAQILLASGALECQDFSHHRPNVDPPRREWLVAAETYARLAASDNDPKGVAALAAVLLARADDLEADCPLRSADARTEAEGLLYGLAMAGVVEAGTTLIAGLNARADAGSEDAAAMLVDVVAALPIDVVCAALEAQPTRAVA